MPTDLCNIFETTWRELAVIWPVSTGGAGKHDKVTVLLRVSSRKWCAGWTTVMLQFYFFTVLKPKFSIYLSQIWEIPVFRNFFFKLICLLINRRLQQHFQIH